MSTTQAKLTPRVLNNALVRLAWHRRCWEITRLRGIADRLEERNRRTKVAIERESAQLDGAETVATYELLYRLLDVPAGTDLAPQDLMG
jgi:hypothetical protein